MIADSTIDRTIITCSTLYTAVEEEFIGDYSLSTYAIFSEMENLLVRIRG